MADKQGMLESIAATKAKILEMQEQIANAGMSKAEEAEVESALRDLSQTVNPDVPNPPDPPADPSAPTP